MGAKAHFVALVAVYWLSGDFYPMPTIAVVTTHKQKSMLDSRGGIELCTAEFATAVDLGGRSVLVGHLVPLMAAKAVALAEARRPDCAGYAEQIVANARALAEVLLRRGARLVTGGTDNHLLRADVGASGLAGRQAEAALLDAGLVTNRNAVPA